MPPTPTRAHRSVTAAVTLLMAGVLLAHVPTLGREATYLGVLAAMLGVLGALAGIRLWQGCRCAAPVTTLAVAGLLLGGQLLNLLVGLPGAAALRGGLGPTNVTMLVLEVLVAALVVAPVLRRRRLEANSLTADVVAHRLAA